MMSKKILVQAKEESIDRSSSEEASTKQPNEKDIVGSS